MGRQAKALIATCALLALVLTAGVSSAVATAPTVSIDPASDVSYTSAHLSGKVDPQDRETTYHFEYQEAALWWMGWTSGTSHEPLFPNSGEAAVEDDLGGLKPATEYAVRLVAENYDGQTVSSEPNPTFTTAAVGPAAVSIDAPSAITSSSAHFSGTINPEAPGGNPAAFGISDWHFECTPACPELTVTEGAAPIPADSSDHTVAADVTGLEPGVTYEVTLIATNAGGQASSGSESFATAVLAPEILQVSAVPSITEASLAAMVNPGGLESTYHFEYGPTTAYGSSSGPQTLAAGGAPVSAKADLFGLLPNSTYHYRLVVSNSQGTVEGSDQTFTTNPSEDAVDACPNAAIRAEQGSRYLPRCRAYELVSPAEKNGLSVTYSPSSVFAPTLVARDGDQMTFNSLGTFGGSPTQGNVTSFLARRTPAGWISTPYSPAPGIRDPELGTKTVPLDATDDFSMAFGSTGDKVVPGDETFGFFGYDTVTWGSDGSLEAVSRPDTGSWTGTHGSFYKGRSENGDHVLFENGVDSLAAGEAGHISGRQLFDRTGDRTYLVGVDTNGNAMQCGSGLGAGGRWNTAVSADGSQVVFRTPGDFWEDPACDLPSQLYIRRDNSTTIHLSASRRTPVDPSGTQGASFEGAAKDGSVVYFSSPERLTNDPANDAAGGLYAYTVASDSLDFIAAGGRVVAMSDDGLTVYITAGEAAETTLNVLDEGVLEPITKLPGAELNETSEGLRPARTVPDGSRLVFLSRGNLEGDGSEGEFFRAFLFDLESGQLVCMSCRPGAEPTGDSLLVGQAVFNDQRTQLSANISADGQSVFFQSPEALVSSDSNGRNDVYEFRDGQVRLLSSGTGRYHTYFVGASRDGTNVYMATANAYVAEDTDNGGVDMYDVRVGGGFPSTAAVVNDEGCTGDSCQGAAGSPPAPPGIGSVFVEAGGRRNGSNRKLIVKQSSQGPVATLRIQTGRAGTVVVRAPGLKRVVATVGGSGVAHLRVLLKQTAREKLARVGRLTVRARVYFRPKVGAAITKHVLVRFSQSQTKGGR